MVSAFGVFGSYLTDHYLRISDGNVTNASYVQSDIIRRMCTKTGSTIQDGALSNIQGPLHVAHGNVTTNYGVIGTYLSDNVIRIQNGIINNAALIDVNTINVNQLNNDRLVIRNGNIDYANEISTNTMSVGLLKNGHSSLQNGNFVGLNNLVSNSIQDGIITISDGLIHGVREFYGNVLNCNLATVEMFNCNVSNCNTSTVDALVSDSLTVMVDVQLYI